MTPPLPQFAQLKLEPVDAQLIATWILAIVADERIHQAGLAGGIIDRTFGDRTTEIIREVNRAYIAENGIGKFIALARQFMTFTDLTLDGGR